MCRKLLIKGSYYSLFILITIPLGSELSLEKVELFLKRMK